MIRRFEEPVVRGQRYYPRPGAYAIICSGTEMLVTLQTDPTPEIQLPGGGIDAGEGAIQALHREVFEETGWSITSPRKIGAFRRFAYMPEYDMWAEKLCHIYFARPALRRCAPLEPTHAALWMPAELACQELGNAGDRHFTRSFFRL